LRFIGRAVDPSAGIARAGARCLHCPAMKITRALLRESWRSWYGSDMRIVGPGWLQLVWTFLFCAAIAVAFTIIGFAMFGSGEGAWRNWRGWARWYGLNLVVSCCVGYTIHALFALSTRWIGADRIRGFSNGMRAVYFAGVPIVGMAIGWPIGVWLVSGGRFFGPGQDANLLVGSVLISLLATFLMYLHFDAKARQIAAEKQATEAQLKLLQAQIEPHFLFNTLANVQALIEHEPAKARTMLEAFVDYLRASLDKMRRDVAPLESELALAEAYLRLLSTRMEERLRYEIDVGEGLRQVPLPPLLLQPLVENAVQHGLEPKIEGGTVNIRARAEGPTLVLEVSDDGLGPQASAGRNGVAGNGLAMDNIRARLQSRYGSDASLALSANIAGAGGTRATLRLPIEPPAIA